MSQVSERVTRARDELAAVEIARAEQPSADSLQERRTQAQEKLALYAISALFMAALALLLSRIVTDSAAQFGAGIRIAEDAYRQGAHPSAMTRRIFLLASGHHVVTFKAAAFVISAGIIVFGAFFVLKGVQASYRLSVERLDVRSSLATTSPGLVIITFGALLAAVTLLNQSHLRETLDYDLQAPAPAFTPIRPEPGLTDEAGEVEEEGSADGDNAEHVPIRPDPDE